MPSDDIKLILVTIAVTVGVITLLFTIRNRIVDNREKISLTHTMQAMLVGQNLDYSGIVLRVYMLNAGNKALHVHRPYIRLPYKQDGFDQFEMISLKDDAQYPIKLEPGEEHSTEMALENMLNCFSFLKPYRRVRFEVKTTKGKTYKSKKVWFKDFLKQGDLHETLVKNNA